MALADVHDSHRIATVLLYGCGAKLTLLAGKGQPARLYVCVGRRQVRSSSSHACYTPAGWQPSCDRSSAALRAPAWAQRSGSILLGSSASRLHTGPRMRPKALQGCPRRPARRMPEWHTCTGGFPLRGAPRAGCSRHGLRVATLAAAAPLAALLDEMLRAFA